jgi:hypothetical protein
MVFRVYIGIARVYVSQLLCTLSNQRSDLSVGSTYVFLLLRKYTPEF